MRLPGSAASVPTLPRCVSSAELVSLAVTSLLRATSSARIVREPAWEQEK